MKGTKKTQEQRPWRLRPISQRTRSDTINVPREVRVVPLVMVSLGQIKRMRRPSSKVAIGRTKRTFEPIASTDNAPFVIRYLRASRPWVRGRFSSVIAIPSGHKPPATPNPPQALHADLWTHGLLTVLAVATGGCGRQSIGADEGVSWVVGEQ